MTAAQVVIEVNGILQFLAGLTDVSAIRLFTIQVEFDVFAALEAAECDRGILAELRCIHEAELRVVFACSAHDGCGFCGVAAAVDGANLEPAGVAGREIAVRRVDEARFRDRVIVDVVVGAVFRFRIGNIVADDIRFRRGSPAQTDPAGDRGSDKPSRRGRRRSVLDERAGCYSPVAVDIFRRDAQRIGAVVERGKIEIVIGISARVCRAVGPRRAFRGGFCAVFGNEDGFHDAERHVVIKLYVGLAVVVEGLVFFKAKVDRRRFRVGKRADRRVGCDHVAQNAALVADANAVVVRACGAFTCEERIFVRGIGIVFLGELVFCQRLFARGAVDQDHIAVAERSFSAPRQRDLADLRLGGERVHRRARRVVHVERRRVVVGVEAVVQRVGRDGRIADLVVGDRGKTHCDRATCASGDGGGVPGDRLIPCGGADLLIGAVLNLEVVIHMVHAAVVVVDAGCAQRYGARQFRRVVDIIVIKVGFGAETPIVRVFGRRVVKPVIRACRCAFLPVQDGIRRDIGGGVQRDRRGVAQHFTVVADAVIDLGVGAGVAQRQGRQRRKPATLGRHRRLADRHAIVRSALIAGGFAHLCPSVDRVVAAEAERAGIARAGAVADAVIQLSGVIRMRQRDLDLVGVVTALGRDRRRGKTALNGQLIRLMLISTIVLIRQKCQMVFADGERDDTVANAAPAVRGKLCCKPAQRVTNFHRIAGVIVFAAVCYAKPIRAGFLHVQRIAFTGLVEQDHAVGFDDGGLRQLERLFRFDAVVPRDGVFGIELFCRVVGARGNLHIPIDRNGQGAAACRRFAALVDVIAEHGAGFRGDRDLGRRGKRDGAVVIIRREDRAGGRRCADAEGGLHRPGGVHTAFGNRCPKDFKIVVVFAVNLDRLGIERTVLDDIFGEIPLLIRFAVCDHIVDLVGGICRGKRNVTAVFHVVGSLVDTALRLLHIDTGHQCSRVALQRARRSFLGTVHYNSRFVGNVNAGRWVIFNIILAIFLTLRLHARKRIVYGATIGDIGEEHVARLGDQKLGIFLVFRIHIKARRIDGLPALCADGFGQTFVGIYAADPQGIGTGGCGGEERRQVLAVALGHFAGLPILIGRVFDIEIRPRDGIAGFVGELAANAQILDFVVVRDGKCKSIGTRSGKRNAQRALRGGKFRAAGGKRTGNKRDR